MHPLTLRFPPELERRFRETTYPRLRSQSRVALAVASVNLLGLAAWFGLLVPASDGGATIGLLFLASAIPAALGLVMTWMPGYAERRGPVQAASILGTGIAAAAISYLVPTVLGATITTVSVVVILLFGMVFVGADLAWATPACVVIAVGSFATIAGNDLGWAYTSAYGLGVISAVAGAIGAGYFVERYMRSDFIHQQELEAERQRSERLLLNVLPLPIAERLKAGEEPIADAHSDATVLFADIVNFTGISSKVSPDEMVRLLNDVFTEFDKLAAKHGLEKIKTIGDAYMAVSGLPQPRADHAEACAELALEMQQCLSTRVAPTGDPLRIRVGINSGPVVAGVIGTAKFAYDLWGDAVNTASRMESHGVPEGIQVTESTYGRLSGKYRFEPRGEIEVKGKGLMQTYLSLGRAAPVHG